MHPGIIPNPICLPSQLERRGCNTLVLEPHGSCIDLSIKSVALLVLRVQLTNASINVEEKLYAFKQNDDNCVRKSGYYTINIIYGDDVRSAEWIFKDLASCLGRISPVTYVKVTSLFHSKACDL
jgi:hypothetical protein